MDYKGLKTGRGAGQAKEERENKWIKGAKNRAMAGWANQRKKEKINEK